MTVAGSFLNGLMQGVERRRAWDRQKRVEKIEDEDREWLRYERNRKRSADDRADSQRADSEAAYQDAYQATKDSYQTPTETVAPADLDRPEQTSGTAEAGPKNRAHSSGAPEKKPVRRTLTFSEKVDAANNTPMPASSNRPLTYGDLQPQSSPQVTAPSQPKSLSADPNRAPVAPKAHSDPVPAGRTTRRDQAYQRRSLPSPSAPSKPAHPTPADRAPVMPDPAPAPLPAPSQRFGVWVEKMGLERELGEAAQLADQADYELTIGRNAVTGVPLDRVQRQERIKLVSDTEKTLRSRSEYAQPRGEHPQLDRPSPNESANGLQHLNKMAGYQAERVRRAIVPPPRQPANIGPDMSDVRPDQVNTAANRAAQQEALSVQANAPQMPGAEAPAPAPQPSPPALPRRSLPGATPAVDNTLPGMELPVSATPAPSPDAVPAASAPQATPAETAASGDPTALDSAIDANPERATPAIEAAAVASQNATRGISLANASSEVVNSRAKLAGKSFLEHYAKVGAPKMVEFYVKQGDMKKAAAFQEFIDRTDTKAAMKNWADAVFSASIGDDKRFLDSLTDAYNAKGYFDDGYETVRDKSELTRDSQGNINGARITFRDKQSGQEFTQQLDDQRDLYELGIHMLSPEQVFEHGWSRIAAAEAARAKDLDARRKQQLKGGTDHAKITKTLEMLAKNDLSFANLPLDEQVAQAQNFLERFNPDGSLKQPSQGGAVPLM